MKYRPITSAVVTGLLAAGIAPLACSQTAKETLNKSAAARSKGTRQTTHRNQSDETEKLCQCGVEWTGLRRQWSNDPESEVSHRDEWARTLVGTV